jgi:ADP-ribosyl-[dinitrogen reductase] hydrolase
MTLPPRSDLVRGALLGMLVGDALGVPYEFHHRDDLPPLTHIEMVPPAGFSRSHARIAPGTWSDDGAQALALLASLLERGHLDVDDFATRLLTWYEEGYMAVDGVVFDVGVQTSRAFRALKQGVSPRDSGPAEERDNGNGSLMRVLPLALWHRGSDAELVRDAFAQSAVTHGHPRSKICCALYCLWIRRLLGATTSAGAAAAWGRAVAALRALIVGDDAAQEALEMHVRPDEPATGHGSGYVVDTLSSARMIFDAVADDPAGVELGLRRAVALGDDTDTTACVLGGLLGARAGAAAIPARWLASLRGMEMVEPLLRSLMHALGDDPSAG